MIAAPEAIDWPALVRLPSTVLFALAGLALLIALVQLVKVSRRVRQRRPLAAVLRTVLVLVAAALALVFGGAGWSLRGYRLLAAETPVLALDARILSPQHWRVSLQWPDGSRREVPLYGDAWRVEAVVLKWRLPALFAGLPPLYRLDRLSGRYDDAVEERNAPRTVVDFNRAGRLDLLELARRHPGWLPMVDTVHGSGTYLPLVDEGHYTVRLMATGALVARPDAATAERLAQAL